MTGDQDPQDPIALAIVDDATFMENVREALGNGCEAVCAYCGTGLAGDGLDMHERGCPYHVDVR